MANLTATLGVSFKTKLPKGWSYPVGAEVLTNILGDLDDWAPKPLHFQHSKPCLTVKDRRRLRLEDGPFVVIEVGRRTALGVEEGSTDRPQWRIIVRSVPSQLTQSVRACLLAEGLPPVRKWMTKNFSPTAVNAGPLCRLLLRAEREVMRCQTRSSQFADFQTEELPCPLAERPMKGPAQSG